MPGPDGSRHPCRRRDHAEEFLDGDDGGNRRAQIHHRLVLADAAIARSDWATANRLTREALVTAPSRTGRPPASRVGGSPRATAVHGSTPVTGPYRDLTPAEQRVLQLLATHFTLGEIADHLLRVTQHRQDTHGVDLSQAQRLRPERGDRAGEPNSDCSTRGSDERVVPSPLADRGRPSTWPRSETVTNRASAAVAPIVATVLPSVDAMADDGGGAHHCGGAGNGGADNTSADGSCGS